VAALEKLRPLEQLAKNLGCHWPNIEAAKKETQRRQQELLDALSIDAPVDSVDRSVVAFGSIAREEATDESDLDWTLLVDGQADPQHLQITQEIAKRVTAHGFKEPGPTGVFGHMAFSHEIIHNIGGQSDTNRNLTQRVLLLLESIPIGQRREAYDRVITGVLHRYILEDAGLTHAGAKVSLPRFLLNDIARFWRTMAVDFANKQRERGGQGWGLRNAKLRFSRKLVFASGLLLCFRCVLNPPEASTEEADAGYANAIVNRLKEFVPLTPLDNVADAVLTYGVSSEVAKKLFGCYDQFLGVLSDGVRRDELENLRPSDAGASETFQYVRTISHEFQFALNQVFFDHERIGKLTREYGVF